MDKFDNFDAVISQIFGNGPRLKVGVEKVRDGEQYYHFMVDGLEPNARYLKNDYLVTRDLGKWVKWEYHFIMAERDGGNDVFKAYHDGDLCYEWDGGSMNRWKENTYFKVGIYGRDSGEMNERRG